MTIFLVSCLTLFGILLAQYHPDQHTTHVSVTDSHIRNYLSDGFLQIRRYFPQGLQGIQSYLLEGVLTANLFLKMIYRHPFQKNHCVDEK